MTNLMYVQSTKSLMESWRYDRKKMLSSIIISNKQLACTCLHSFNLFTDHAVHLVCCECINESHSTRCCFILTGWRALGAFYSYCLIKCVSLFTRWGPDWRSREIRSVCPLIHCPVFLSSFFFFFKPCISPCLFVTIMSTRVFSLLFLLAKPWQNNDEITDIRC